MLGPYTSHGLGENPGRRVVFTDGHRVLEVGGERAVFRHHGPLVVKGPNLGPPDIHHRLDRDRHTRDEPGTPLRLPVVGHLRVFVNPGPDAVSPDPPPHRLPGPPRHFLPVLPVFPDVIARAARGPAARAPL